MRPEYIKPGSEPFKTIDKEIQDARLRLLVATIGLSASFAISAIGLNLIHQSTGAQILSRDISWSVIQQYSQSGLLCTLSGVLGSGAAAGVVISETTRLFAAELNRFKYIKPQDK